MQRVLLNGIITLLCLGFTTSASAFDWQWLYPNSAYFGPMYSETTGAEGMFINGDHLGFGAGFNFNIAPKVRWTLEWNYVPYEFIHADGDTMTMEFGDDPWAWSYWGELKPGLVPYEGFYDLDFVANRVTHTILLGINVQPLQTGRIRPQFYGGLGTHIFLRKFYYQINWDRKFAAGSLDSTYPFEITQEQDWRFNGDVKKRGVVLSVYGGAGIDLLLNDVVGLNFSARFHRRLKDHKFDHWTGIWAVRGGLVFYY